MSLVLTNSQGQPDETYLRNSLVNASFTMMPKISAHYTNLYGTVKHAATCYEVQLGQNRSEANYSQRGVVYSNDTCVSTHLSDFAVFIDDLAAELALLETDTGDLYAF